MCCVTSSISWQAYPIVSDTPSLRDAWVRFDWAEDDCQALNDLLTDFPNTDTYSTQMELRGDRRYATFRCLVDPTTEAERLNPIAHRTGAVLDNLRAALNYLTYQVALLALTEDPTLDLHPEAVEFPIFNDLQLFRDKNRVKKLPDKYRTRLEAVQAYHGGHQGLWMLHELSREYRHRLIHPMAVYPFGEYRGLFREEVHSAILDLDVTYTGEILKDGDELFNFAMADNFEAYMTPPIIISIGLDHSLCRGRTLITLLQDMVYEVGDVLRSWVPDLSGGVPDWVAEDGTFRILGFDQ